jgi:DNA-binding transcriptional regulator YiaG
VTGAEVRRLRRRLGLTQAQFAERVAVHRVTVTRWEQGVLRIRESTARFLRLLAKVEPKPKSKR